MNHEKSSDMKDTVKTVLYAILIALGIRTVAYEPFNIPSGSMIPTLLVGDYLFVFDGGPEHAQAVADGLRQFARGAASE